MPDIIQIILKKILRNTTPKHNGNTFCPCLTLRDPPGEAQVKLFHTQNVPDIIRMIQKENYKEIRSKKHNGNPFCPWVTLKDPPGEAQVKHFHTQNVPDIIRMILKEKYKEI